MGINTHYISRYRIKPQIRSAVDKHMAGRLVYCQLQVWEVIYTVE